MSLSGTHGIQKITPIKIYSSFRRDMELLASLEHSISTMQMVQQKPRILWCASNDLGLCLALLNASTSDCEHIAIHLGSFFKVCKLGSLKRLSKRPPKGNPFMGSLLKVLFADLNLETPKKTPRGMRALLPRHL